MTDKEKIAVELAKQHLCNIRNNIPMVSAIRVNHQWHLENTWNEAMSALRNLEELTK